MLLFRQIEDYHFLADSITGITFRWGKSIDDNPTYAPVPELADISISNRCSKACSFCYKDSTPDGKIMTFDEYCYVLDCLNSPEHGTVFQVAIGGGEPLEHPDFLKIVNETVERGIVFNFTTNGRLLTPEVFDLIRGKVGAMAISISSMLEWEEIKDALKGSEGIKVNIHYILSKASIQEAIRLVNGVYNEMLKGVNAVIFLTYKPAGRGTLDWVLNNDIAVNELLKAIKSPKNTCKLGFDACFVPILLHNHAVRKDIVDTCEGGFFSVYVDEHMRVSPCSFSGGKDTYSLKEYDFYDIWLNKLQPYRSTVRNRCKRICSVHDLCRGNCPYYPQITRCYQK